MASEQNKTKRYVRLDRLLRHSTGYTLDELLQDPLMDDISKRTLRDDLKDFKTNYGAQFDDTTYRGRKRIWKYKDSSFSIYQQFNRDIEVIRKAIQRLQVFKGDPRYDWLRLFLMMLENGVHNNKPFMSFDNNLGLRGLDNIEVLGMAILHKHPVRLKYKPFEHDAFSTNVHPYYLKQYNNRWFLMAWSEEKSSILNYAIDRIIKIEHLSKPFKQTEIDFDKYFDDVVGVTLRQNAKKEKVLLRINKKSIDYILTKPLHKTQAVLTEMETANEAYLQLDVKVNVELKMLLFSYSDAIEVLEPAWLRDFFAERIKKMNNMYKV